MGRSAADDKGTPNGLRRTPVLKLVRQHGSGSFWSPGLDQEMGLFDAY